MNNLFINVAGRGEPLLVLHGWGMDHTIWSPVKQSLEQSYTVTWLDLPGHGQNTAYDADNLTQIVMAVRAVMPAKTHIMGWSLGGLVAQRLAYLYPQEISSLILVATSPTFVQKTTWRQAMAEQVLITFANELEHNYVATLKRFLALQFMGVKEMQATLINLRKRIAITPPTRQALRVGLDILRTTDLRQQQSTHKRLWLLGKMDKLIPVGVQSDLRACNPHDQLHVMNEAGHAPFVSHPALFTHHVIEFLRHV